MRRSMVGLLAAAGAAMSVFAALTHNDVFLLIIAAVAGAATGSAACLALPAGSAQRQVKKSSGKSQLVINPVIVRRDRAPGLASDLALRRQANVTGCHQDLDRSPCVPGPGLWPGPRRQARWVGRGSSLLLRLLAPAESGGINAKDLQRRGLQALVERRVTPEPDERDRDPDGCRAEQHVPIGQDGHSGPDDRRAGQKSCRGFGSGASKPAHAVRTRPTMAGVRAPGPQLKAATAAAKAADVSITLGYRGRAGVSAIVAVVAATVLHFGAPSVFWPLNRRSVSAPRHDARSQFCNCVVKAQPR